MEQLEHPEITRCLETGYPYPAVKVMCCEECDADLVEGEYVFSVDGNGVCEECFMDWVYVKKAIQIAELMGIDTAKAEGD